MAKVEITTGFVSSQIVVDGHDIGRALTGFTFEGRPGDHRLRLEVLLHETVLRGEATVDIPQRTREALIALGWSPPGPFIREPLAVDDANAERRHLSAHAHGGETP